MYTVQVPPVTYCAEPGEPSAVSWVILPQAGILDPRCRIQPGRRLAHKVVHLLHSLRGRDVRIETCHRKLRHDDREPEQSVVFLHFLPEAVESCRVDMNRQVVRPRLRRDQREPFLPIS